MEYMWSVCVQQCMLMCKKVALVTSGNRHALHALVRIPVHTFVREIVRIPVHISVLYTFTFSSSIISNISSNIK